MTEENIKLRDTLKAAEAIVTSALGSQPENDADCRAHLKNAVYDVMHTIAKAAVIDDSRPIDEIVMDGKDDTAIGMRTMGCIQSDLADRIEKASEAERTYFNAKNGGEK